jgi:hypothetical protein
MYSNILRSFPSLDLRKPNLQHFMRNATVPLYIAIHAVYMSGIFRARLPMLREMTHIANNQRDSAIVVSFIGFSLHIPLIDHFISLVCAESCGVKPMVLCRAPATSYKWQPISRTHSSGSRRRSLSGKSP